MQPRRLELTVLVLYLASLGGVSSAQDVIPKGKNLVEVIVAGSGMDKEEATRDALRKAVERAAGTFIHSQTQIKDFALVRDTVLTRSAGFIQEHRILVSKEDDDGVWEVKIRAVVSVKGIEHMWGVVKNMLQQMGRPKVMVFISERIRGLTQDDSTVQTQIEKRLLKSGFLLVNRNQINAIQRKDLEAAVAEDNPAKLQAVAKRFGAQLFISGSTAAARGETKAVYGVTLYRASADGDIKCYRSDTAQLLSAQNATTATADKDSFRKAAKRALDQLGKKLAPRVQTDVLQFWSEVLAGRGELVLEVQGVSFKQYVSLKKRLAKVKPIKGVTATFANNIAKCSIQSDLKAEALAERLVKELENLEITDVSQNVIKAKWNE